MTGKLIRRKTYYCDVKTRRDNSSTLRALSGNTLSEVINRAIKLYQTSWGKDPDSIDLICKNIVN